jgi:superfamily II DNA or RNA helicase
MNLRPKVVGYFGSGMPVIKNCPPLLGEQILAACSLPNPDYERIAKYSAYGPPKWMPKTLEFAHCEGDDVYFPRGFSSSFLNKEALDDWNRIKWVDLTRKVPVTFPKVTDAINANQKAIVAALTRSLKLNTRPFGNFLFIVPTSGGKSLAQIKCAQVLGQRTLVLCGSNLVRKAWVDDIVRFTKTERRDIGLIQQSTWRIGEVFTLGMVATIIRRTQGWDELFNEFGTIIFDEVDSLVSGQIREFTLRCGSPYMIGATATDRPSTYVANRPLDLMFGPPLLRKYQTTKATETMLPVAKAIVIKTSYTPTLLPPNVGWHEFIEELALDEDRNQLICDNVLSDWQQGYCPLVVTQSVSHANLLQSMLSDLIPDCNLITGVHDRKANERLVDMILSTDVRCLVATQQCVTRGANINPLDRIHITTPIRSQRVLEQLVGRIRRTHPSKDDAQIRYYLDVNSGLLQNVFKASAYRVFCKLNLVKTKAITFV